MGNNTTLFTVSPEDLILKIKAGDSESAFILGLLCLSGIGVKQSLDQANSYFAKAKQLGATDTDVFDAYIHECKDQMIKAIDTYAGKDPSSTKKDSYASRISRRFKKVLSERKRLLRVLREYGLPDCPMNTALGSLMQDFESGQKSLADICSIVSLSDNNEHWCHDTAGLLLEDGDVGLANMWLKKCSPGSDDEILKKILDKKKELAIRNLTSVDLKGCSLLGKSVSIKILPEGLFTSNDAFRKALMEWGRDCSKKRESYFEEIRRQEEEQKKRLEEERKRKAEEERKKRIEEERRKAEEEERARMEAKRKEAMTFIVGRYGIQRDEIQDKTVSRQHCRVSLREDGMVEIENLSQSNGTVVDGNRIEKTVASMDSILKMGNYTIKVRDLFPPRKSSTNADKQRTM